MQTTQDAPSRCQDTKMWDVTLHCAVPLSTAMMFVTWSSGADSTFMSSSIKCVGVDVELKCMCLMALYCSVLNTFLCLPLPAAPHTSAATINLDFEERWLEESFWCHLHPPVLEEEESHFGDKCSNILAHFSLFKLLVFPFSQRSSWVTGIEIFMFFFFFLKSIS